MKLIHILRNRRTGTERGAALLLIAMSLTAVITTMGLVVDGSNAFATRRQMQNAADSGALAGTRELDRLVTNGESAIWNAVVTSATSNGADAANITCRLTNDMLGDLGACPTTNTGTALALRSTVSAVKVKVGTTKATSFIRIAGVNQFTARATAAAQLQRLLNGGSPFIMCAVGTADASSMGDGLAAGKAILIRDPVDSTKYIVNTTVIDPTPSVWTDDTSRTYDLQSPQVPRCGQGTQFKGLSQDLNVFTVPGEADIYNGTHGVNVSSTVIAGNAACRGTLTEGCVILVPLCHAVQISAGPPAVYGKNDRLYCERFAAFRVVDAASSSRIAGVLVDQGLVTSGQGGGHAGSGEAHLLKLSE
jgi:Flp pilus assembly protein TadG